MSRTAQFVVLVVVLLLAGQPALAEAPCSLWIHSGGGHAPACCIPANDNAAAHLRANCHESMRLESIASACNQSDCRMAAVTVGTQAVTPTKSRADKATALVGMAQLPLTPASNVTTRPFENASSPGPAKYLLFQVFRI